MSTAVLSAPLNILTLSTKEKRAFLDSFDYIFSDIDGVVWTLQHVIKGAAEGFKELKAAGKKVTFITNNGVRPVRKLVDKFSELGLDISENEIIHPARSVIDYLNSIKFEGLIYVIASDLFRSELREAGYDCIDGPNEIIDESYAALASHIFDNQPVRAVIIDVDFNLSSVKLIRAHIYLNNPECLLITGATDMLLPVRKDVSIIGPGPFAKVIAESSRKEMITLGKPGKELVQMLIKRYKITHTKRVLMIGDMLDQDIALGREGGFQTLLVLSGGCSREELSKAKSAPDYCAESAYDFVEFMRDIKRSTA